MKSFDIKDDKPIPVIQAVSPLLIQKFLRNLYKIL